MGPFDIKLWFNAVPVNHLTTMLLGPLVAAIISVGSEVGWLQ